jgi:hypothetical protein
MSEPAENWGVNPHMSARQARRLRGDYRPDVNGRHRELQARPGGGRAHRPSQQLPDRRTLEASRAPWPGRRGLPPPAGGSAWPRQDSAEPLRPAGCPGTPAGCWQASGRGPGQQPDHDPGQQRRPEPWWTRWWTPNAAGPVATGPVATGPAATGPAATWDADPAAGDRPSLGGVRLTSLVLAATVLLALGLLARWLGGAA